MREKEGAMKNVLEKIEAVTKEKDVDFQTAAKKAVRLLHSEVPHYHWVGIYMTQGSDLVLKAWDGPEATEHTRIKIGEGICGLAAQRKQAIIVDDVSQEPDYIQCFPNTRSEIVVPIFKDKKVIGEIDIDSDMPAAFDGRDKELLEKVAELLSEKYKEED